MIGIIWTFLSGGLSRLFGALAKLPWQVWLVIAAAFFSLAMWSNAHHWKKVSERRKTEIVALNAALATSNASIKTLEAAIAAKNAETEARAKAYDQSKRDYAAMLKAADARQKATAGRVSALLALAKDAEAKGACRVPAGLLGDMEGL